MNTKERNRIKTLLTLTVVAMATLGLAAASANTGEIFYESFEKPVVAGYVQGAIPAAWVGANQGFNSTWHGLDNKASGDFTADAVSKDQAYAFRYTNSGLTTAEGVIGALEEATYTVVFDVVRDDGALPGLPYNVQLIAFAAGAARNDCRSTPAGSTLLATGAGNATDDGAWTTVSFDFTVPTGHADLGKDIGVRLIGATNSAIIDNVQVLGPVVGPKFYSPRDGDYVPPSSNLELKWTNADPNDPNDSVYVDVWFGTDPESLTKVLEASEANADANSLIVDASAPSWYYWRVDSYINGFDNINEPNRIEGPVLSFVNDKPPDRVEVGVNMITWAGEPVPLDATVFGDDGVSPLTYAWTATNPTDPNAVVVFTPGADVEDPTVTITKELSGRIIFTLRLDVNDGTTPETVFKTMTIDVYDDACLMAKGIDPTVNDQTDIDGNCITNLEDFAVVAAAWLDDYTPTAPFAEP